MFSKQMGALGARIRSLGGSFGQLGSMLENVLGQCQAPLEHDGPVTLSGPLKLGGEVRSGPNNGGNGSLGTILFDGLDARFNLDNQTGTLSSTVVKNSMSRVFSVYTLAADLNAGASVVVGDKTFVGSFIRAGYKLPNGTAVGAINGGNDSWYIIAWDACEVVQ